MKNVLATASVGEQMNPLHRVSFGWLRRTFALIAVAAFLSAFLFGALHLIIHHSPHQQDHCSFCKHFNDSRAEAVAPVVVLVQLRTADARPYPTLSPTRLLFILSQDARAPPAAIC